MSAREGSIAAPTASHVVPLGSVREPVGPKADHLRWLAGRGFAVPQSWVCGADVGAVLRRGDAGEIAVLREALAAALPGEGPFAVRSCAAAEDGEQRSWAGQFATALDVRGVDAVVEALREVFASATSARVRAYGEDAAGANPGAAPPAMAALVQRMVEPGAAGVAFSRNPLTGLNEVIVEAVPGRGDALVQGGATPDRWVHKWGAFIEQPEAPRVPPEVAEEVVAGARAIEAAFGRPVDLEWVHDGARVRWVQLRPITAGEVPVYSNRIAREVLPGAIAPLVWSINIPAVNGAWIRLIEELIGPSELRPEQLARRFHHRAYFDMGTMGRIFESLGMPRESLELLLGIEAVGPDKPGFRPSARTMRHLPRMVWFLLAKLRYGRRFERWVPDVRARFDALRPPVGLDQRSPGELLDSVERLRVLTAEAAYANIVVPLLMQVYGRLLERSLRRAGVDPDTLDPVRGLDALEALDPNPALDALARQFRALAPATRAALRAAGPDELPGVVASAPDGARFGESLAAFLAQFGHFGDSGNDLTSVPWRERPDWVITMVAERPDAPPRADGRVGFEQLRLPALRRPWIRAIYRRARAFRLYREQVSSLYTWGYGLMRRYVRALGRAAVERGLLADADDVFYLEIEELHAGFAAGAGADGAELAALAAARREDLTRHRDTPLPETIFGDEPPPAPPPADARQLRGTPTSRGYHEGPARVVRGIDEIDRVRDGDVLVIPYSDVGWTPLFARAGAVVAESGGMLSHTSIVAREYGIPAVVSVANACGLADGARVAVDGHTGAVVVLEEER